MNKLQKDILFYSNYCLHSNNLINRLSKTALHNKIFYVCIDDKKIKIPSFINRVPSIYLVSEKTILVEEDIDTWVSNYIQKINSINNQKKLQKELHQQNDRNNIPQIQKPNHADINNPSNNNSNNSSNNPTSNKNFNSNSNLNTQIEKTNKEEDILGYQSLEMGGHLSNCYSFIEDNNNNTLNHNFTFLDESNTSQPINTPKEFSSSKNEIKSELDTDFEKLMESRNGDSFSKGIQRI
jgi:hypothetical protein